MIRWSILMAGYSYDLVHRPGTAVGHADALSRCPLPRESSEEGDPEPVLLVDCANSPLLSSTEIAAHTARDPVMKKLTFWVKRGWPQGPAPPGLNHYWHRRMEITMQGGCLLWGERVIVPEKLRAEVLELLHDSHPGMVRMKSLARSYVWWPSMDVDIEQKVKVCEACQVTRPDPPRVPPAKWESPKGPWSRIHVDFAGPCDGQNFLIIIDAWSKWMEVELMPTTTSQAVIRKLQKIFVTHGLPDVLVSDNGPQLVSTEFEEYLAMLGIRHALVAPGHPNSNGAAERAVRAFKETVQKLTSGNWQDRINKFLQWQHITPSKTTSKSPAELLMGRKLRSVLDRLHPALVEKPTLPGRAARISQVGDRVWVKNFGLGHKWVKGRIDRVTGPYSYIVRLEDDRLWHRHIDQIRPREVARQSLRLEQPQNNSDASLIPPLGGDIPEEGAEVPPASLSQHSHDQGECQNNAAVGSDQLPQPQPEDEVAAAEQTSHQDNLERNEVRKSERARRRPDHFKDFVGVPENLF